MSLFDTGQLFAAVFLYIFNPFPLSPLLPLTSSAIGRNMSQEQEAGVNLGLCSTDQPDALSNIQCGPLQTGEEDQTQSLFRSRVRLLPRALPVVAFTLAERPVMVAALRLHSDALLIIANSTLNPGGDKEARTMCQQSFKGVMPSCSAAPFLICMFVGT